MSQAGIIIDEPAASDDLPGFDPALAIEGDLRYLDTDELDRLLTHVSRIKASDITLQTEEPVIAEVGGKNVRITRRTLSGSEVDEAINLMYGSNGVGRIRSGEDIDVSYSVVVSRAEKYRFRVNVTGIEAYGSTDASQITIRMINGKPPRMKDLSFEQMIIDAYRPHDGLVLVCGGTGNGKSTTLAAMMAEIICDPLAHKKILEFSSPIEFVYDELERSSVIMAQSEIPRHLPSFERAIRGALRRAPKIILVSESRDYLTMSAALEASETGHCVYSTVHADTVHGALYRIVNMFPGTERATRMFEIIEALRMIVVQRLVPHSSGKGRVALREILVFDEHCREALRNTQTLKEAVGLTQSLVEKRGQSLLASAYVKFNAGLVTRGLVASLEAKGKASLLDDLQPSF